MKNGDLPAAPVITPDMPVSGSPGLTKREAYAMAAMQGVISSTEATCYANHETVGCNQPDSIAQYAVACADALLEELEKHP